MTMMNKNPAYETDSWDIPIEEFEWRLMRTVNMGGNPTGVYVAYPDARTVAVHLDRLFGQDGWMDNYQITPDGKAVTCTLKVLMNGEWISKVDVGVMTDIEPHKGGFSDAFKRAAAKLGVGRNAYAIPEVLAPVQKVGEKFFKPRKDGNRPFDLLLLELARNLLNEGAPPASSSEASVAPGEEPKPKARQEAAPAPKAEAIPDEDLIPPAKWKSFMETMQKFPESEKNKIKAWWADNGDGTSSPSPTTDPAIFEQLMAFVNVVNAEFELVAPPF